MQRRRRLVGVGLAALLGAALLAAPTGASAQEGPPGGAAPDDTIEVGPDYNGGRPLPIEGAATQRRAASVAADEGETKTWLALDDAEGSIYTKDYVLRGVGEHIEVWVAADLDFQDGDCRNDGTRTVITDEQVDYFIGEFDDNILPLESEALSVAPERDGSNAQLPALLGLPADYYAGEGDNTIVLLDNVRDDNYYDEDNSQGLSYIAGFFYSVFNEYFDRNVMTVDAFDWLHRTGAAPPDDPSSDLCVSAPARPFLYEGVFAHEYQHLLMHYTDPDESSWVNEGIADWAQTLTGYVDPAPGVDSADFDSHIQCFLGNLGTVTSSNPNPRNGGPENSLTLWEDQGADEILCDYGAAYTMMELLHGRYGTEFMTAFHNDPEGGLASLDKQLADFGTGTTAQEVLHDWATAMALDSVLDANGGKLIGGGASRYQVPTLDAAINWETTDAYDTPGAPPNGSDYVRLRNAAGQPLRLRDVESLTFDGAGQLPSLPVEWAVDESGGADGGPALHSGAGDNLDRAIVTEVAVPAGGGQLTFDTRYETEQGWDFGYVQVSTDGGETYNSLPATGTTDVADPGAVPAVQANLPGFTGDSGGWVASSADLSAFAGQTVLVSFRYISDPAVTEPGYWVDNVALDGTVISDGASLAPFSSPTEINPVDVAGWNVTIVAYSSTSSSLPALLTTLPLDGAFDATSGKKLFPGGPRGNPQYDVVGVIVTHDDPSETVGQYAPYALTANGVVQPGGA